MSRRLNIFITQFRHRLLRLAKRRVVFIDCGANTGAILEEEIRKYPAREYFAFEANPELIRQLDSVKNRHPGSAITIINKAVWIADSSIDFFLSRENSFGERVTDGSTLLHGKVPVHPGSGRIDYQNPVQIEALDFSQWILRTFNRHDYIYLKMDIEGAEYAVLAKMIQDKSIGYINEALVEFHYRQDRKLEGITQGMHDSLCVQVAQATNLILWR